MAMHRTVEVRRVVVSGVGVVSPLGVGVGKTWWRVLNGDTGVRRLRAVAVDERLNVRIAAQLPLEDEVFVNGVASERHARFTSLAVLAAREAIADAGPALPLGPRAGCAIASGIGSLDDAIDATRLVDAGKRVSTFFVPRLLANMAAGAVSMEHDLRGPNLCPASACAAGAHALGEAYRIIERGDADVMKKKPDDLQGTKKNQVAGASEASVTALALHGFGRLRALASGFNDEPEAAARPFDAQRQGFVLGEGAAVLVLESLESALKRSATVYAEVRGFGMSAVLAIQGAFRNSGLVAEDVGYVNAHAASTPYGDAAEARAIEKAFAPRKETDQILVSSTKGATGHLLGAAGAIEALMCVLALRDRLVPHTRNLALPLKIGKGTIDFVRDGPRPAPALGAALTTSFGFGGTNAALLFSQAPSDLVRPRAAVPFDPAAPPFRRGAFRRAGDEEDDQGLEEIVGDPREHGPDTRLP